MVTVTAHRKMLILGVGFFCLPYAALGMDEPYLIDEKLVVSQAPFRRNTIDVLEKPGVILRNEKKSPNSSNASTGIDGAYTPSTISNQKSLFPRRQNSNMALTSPSSSQIFQQDSRKVATPPKPRNHNRKSVSSPIFKIPTHFPVASSQSTNLRTPSIFDSRMEKLNLNIAIDFNKMKDHFRTPILSPVELLSLEFYIKMTGVHRIRLIPMDSDFVDLVAAPRELLICGENNEIYCHTSAREDSLRIKKSNHPKVCGYEAEHYERFVQILKSIKEERDNYFPFLSKGGWKQKDLLESQVRDAWAIERLFNYITLPDYQ